MSTRTVSGKTFIGKEAEVGSKAMFVEVVSGGSVGSVVVSFMEYFLCLFPPNHTH
jgi:hypothetical protein